jgi:4-carboxymuconolactone decarboxylase
MRNAGRIYIYSSIPHFIPGGPKHFRTHCRNAPLEETAMRIALYSSITIICLLALTTVALTLQAAGAESNEVLPNQDRTMPSDIDPQSGFRLPLPKREELDEAGRAAYDRAVTPGRTIAGLQGPAGVQLYSPKIAAHVNAINQYLRYEAAYSPRVREIAILTTAREMDSQFEWVAHEPEALKVGVPAAVIDAIKYRRDTRGLDAADAVIIELGRALWRDHKVRPDLFARAKELFGPHSLIDLVLLMGNYAGTAALLSAVDMQLHPGKQPLLPIP